MVLAAIVLWLLFAFLFWCMLAGATRGDLQIQAALDRSKGDHAERRSLVQDAATDQNSLSPAA